MQTSLSPADHSRIAYQITHELYAMMHRFCGNSTLSEEEKQALIRDINAVTRRVPLADSLPEVLKAFARMYNIEVR